MKTARTLIAAFAAFACAVTASLWNVTPDRTGLAVATAFVVLVVAIVILALAGLVRLIKRKTAP